MRSRRISKRVLAFPGGIVIVDSSYITLMLAGGVDAQAGPHYPKGLSEERKPRPPMRERTAPDLILVTVHTSFGRGQAFAGGDY
ncbi:hypothetical protein AVEN_81037-1 [Araneus ventricosus]|uniref:Uncharacterized protein n=1 Tax=Araneus ventricosus TaxID=182803 RepID=A0A4Y2N1Q4_ARAVE|nr:hypothetical protein AVEN_81037-1 [Araneus ventricosus]